MSGSLAEPKTTFRTPEGGTLNKLVIGVVAAWAFATVANGSAAGQDRSSLPAPHARVLRMAENGNMKAQAELGRMYLTGRGAPQNFYEAAKWYYCAAIQGHPRAQLELGLLYNKGEGVPRDYILSYLWLNLSASQSVGDDRDFKVRLRDSVAMKMTVPDIALAQQMALTWHKTR
jgi:uncharacterized protein